MACLIWQPLTLFVAFELFIGADLISAGGRNDEIVRHRRALLQSQLLDFLFSAGRTWEPLRVLNQVANVRVKS